MADIIFPCTIWFLDERSGATRSATAIAESATCFFAADGAILRKRRTGIGGSLQWTADMAVAAHHDGLFLDRREVRQRQRIEAIQEELELARAGLERLAERRNRWTAGAAP